MRVKIVSDRCTLGAVGSHADLSEQQAVALIRGGVVEPVPKPAPAPKPASKPIKPAAKKKPAEKKL